MHTLPHMSPRKCLAHVCSACPENAPHLVTTLTYGTSPEGRRSQITGRTGSAVAILDEGTVGLGRRRS